MTDTGSAEAGKAEASGHVTVRVRIEGRVQGVWYRGWTVKEATRRGITGWVRNRHDGSVEAVFCGPDEVIRSMIAACHEGPTHARVTDIRAEPVATETFASFEQRPTA